MPTYNTEKLKGRPRFVATRVFFVPRIPSRRIPAEEIHPSPVREFYFYPDTVHSSDRTFTEWGELESEVFYDYSRELRAREYVQTECGRYTATFDKQHNPVRTHYNYSKERWRFIGKNYKEKESYMERIEIDRTYDNRYDETGRLVRRVEHWVRDFGRGPHENSHTTDFRYDDRNRVIMTIEDRDRAVRNTYEGDLLVLEERIFLCHALDLFHPKGEYACDSKKTYRYDSEGNLLEFKNSYSDGSTIWETREYTPEGELRRWNAINSWGSHCSNIRSSFRDGSWYRISVRKDGEDTKIIEYRIHAQDGHGNVTRIEYHTRRYLYDKKKKVWEMERSSGARAFDYVYDSHGNWIRKDIRVGESHYFATREIEYYE